MHMKMTLVIIVGSARSRRRKPDLDRSVADFRLHRNDSRARGRFRTNLTVQRTTPTSILVRWTDRSAADDRDPTHILFLLSVGSDDPLISLRALGSQHNVL